MKKKYAGKAFEGEHGDAVGDGEELVGGDGEAETLTVGDSAAVPEKDDDGDSDGDGDGGGAGDDDDVCVAIPPMAGTIALMETSRVHAPEPVAAVKPTVAVALPSTAAISTASVCA